MKSCWKKDENVYAAGNVVALFPPTYLPIPLLSFSTSIHTPTYFYHLRELDHHTVRVTPREPKPSHPLSGLLDGLDLGNINMGTGGFISIERAPSGGGGGGGRAGRMRGGGGERQVAYICFMIADGLSCSMLTNLPTHLPTNLSTHVDVVREESIGAIFGRIRRATDQ